MAQETREVFGIVALTESAVRERVIFEVMFEYNVLIRMITRKIFTNRAPRPERKLSLLKRLESFGT